VVLGLILLAVATALHVGLLFAARWAAGLPFGERTMRGAWAPDPDGSSRVAFSRAAAGVAGWYLAAAILAGGGAYLGGDEHVDERSMRVRVMPGGPADRAGVKDDDRIMAVDGAPVQDWDELKARITAHDGGPVRLEVERQGARLVLEPEARGSPPRIAVGPPRVHDELGVGAALVYGLAAPPRVLFSIARGTLRTVAGKEHAELVGPVGIVREAGQAAPAGAYVWLRFNSALGAYLLPIIALASLLGAALRRRHANALPTAGKSS
jgi:membrane-associated protease RseP (regulator of RpoE activity)